MWWRAAVDAGLPPAACRLPPAACRLPPGALAGAGVFADSVLPGGVWLPPARAGAEHTPAQEGPDAVAERAVGHACEPDALLLTAHLLARPAPNPWHDVEARQHARALLEAAAALPDGEGSAGTEEDLRRAPVGAGEIDVARTGRWPLAAIVGHVEAIAAMEPRPSYYTHHHGDRNMAATKMGAPIQTMIHPLRLVMAPTPAETPLYASRTRTRPMTTATPAGLTIAIQINVSNKSMPSDIAVPPRGFLDTGA
ncbi:hypothetical protein [Streptomyces sp. NPDC002685]|uniref:hypothetical protein n=1 Tax=Streptomyces sp. NPDC002685 TaxID=3154540 RepID=UPI003324565E